MCTFYSHVFHKVTNAVLGTDDIFVAIQHRQKQQCTSLPVLACVSMFCFYQRQQYSRLTLDEDAEISNEHKV